MTKREWRIGNGSFFEPLLINFASLLRFGKIIEEVGACKLFTCHTRNSNGCLIHVRNLAFNTDYNQRIQAGFNQTAGILRFMPF